MKKMEFTYFDRTQPDPPRPLRRLFLHLDRSGQIFALLLLFLSGVAYLQVDQLPPGTLQALASRLWAPCLLTVIVIYLAALDITATIYEKTTGRIYRRRDQELQQIAERAERSALWAAEESVRVRTRELDQRDSDYAERFQQLRRREIELHEKSSMLNAQIRDARSSAQDQCAGGNRKPKRKSKTSSTFQDLGIP